MIPMLKLNVGNNKWMLFHYTFIVREFGDQVLIQFKNGSCQWHRKYDVQVVEPF